MESGWQLNKIGLLDFWYYDEQEFEFLDGRMLLRGANGSGKSVTMQSFIPLLLDGNMRPERLDPFGSRARRMDNYLLEEEDEREERTGYLYMELKKPKSDNYLTIGIGMRARKNKKMDSWYFCITDGRRVGKDFLLYKDVQSRLTLTKQELRHRVGEGGQVLETQGDYARCVNRRLFGFETMEEYLEMIELLIQLRTPKLSKDFKPSVINEILSRSLQTLSEDDLRPMSEAIENMDNLKTNLNTLEESIHAAKQIERAYDNYNEIVLYKKAALFSESMRVCRELQEKANTLYGQKEACGEALEREEARYESLKQEESVLARERDSLQDSDAARLKEQEIVLRQELNEAQEEVRSKTAKEQEKKDKYREIENKQKVQQEQNEGTKEKIEETLSEMEETLSEVPFDEFAFMRTELTEALEKEYAFQGHVQLLADYTEKVKAGREALQKAENCQERYDRRLQDVDECRARQEQKERECYQCEKLLEETKDETIEKFYLWEKENTRLLIPDEVKQDIAKRLEQYRFGTDYSEIRDLAKEIFYQKEQEIEKKRYETEQERSLVEAEYAKVDEELTQWKNKKDPEPECSEATAKNRALLKEKGIPFLQFYKVVDFGEQLGETRAAYLEEALEAMGILDALIVPAQYREEIRKIDSGVCDRYIFSDVAHVKQNMLALLDVDNEEGDIIKYHNVANILSAIGAQTDDALAQEISTWVDDLGNYRIGVLEGTVTRTHNARYIGVRAREKYRAEKIQALAESAAILQEQIEKHKKTLVTLSEDKEILQTEWSAFPSDVDLKTAAREYADRNYELEQIERQLEELRIALQRAKDELDELMLRVREFCAKCYLPPRLDVFTQAIQDLARYKDLLSEVQVQHGRYLNGIQYLLTLVENLEATTTDLDGIRFELSKANRRASDKEASLRSVQEQLKLTDYEQIRERLDQCIERLSKLPGEKEDAVRQITHWQDESVRLQRELEQQEIDHQDSKIKARRMERAFETEYRLGYVERPFVVNDDLEDQAAKVCQFLETKYGNKNQNHYLSSLQEMFHQNRGYLLEYQLTMQSLSEQEDGDASMEEEISRIDITAKYRGLNVRFKELLSRIQEDAEEQKRLLSDRDRELFEDILANTVSKKIRLKIQASKRWVMKMNQMMDTMHTSSGLKLSLNWKNKHAEKEEQLDTKELVELLSKDVEIMRKEEVNKLSLHFRSKIAEARTLSEGSGSLQSFHAVIREVLDYRKWFEFTLESQKIGEKKKVLTDRVFFTFSGGEKAMAMYVPLFSAVVAKYAGAAADAPRLISLDEAFAGVDETNIRDMFRLMVSCDFNFIINSQVLWGDYDTVPGLSIYHLHRPENAKFVGVTPYVWNGKERILAEGMDKETVYGET